MMLWCSFRLKIVESIQTRRCHQEDNWYWDVGTHVIHFFDGILSTFFKLFFSIICVFSFIIAHCRIWIFLFAKGCVARIKKRKSKGYLHDCDT
jgi:hypothetical protein